MHPHDTPALHLCTGTPRFTDPSLQRVAAEQGLDRAWAQALARVVQLAQVQRVQVPAQVVQLAPAQESAQVVQLAPAQESAQARQLAQVQPVQAQ